MMNDNTNHKLTAKTLSLNGNVNKTVAEAINSTGGFSFLLAAMKVYLEHGIEPNIIVDHDPDSLVKDWAVGRAA